MIERLSVLIPLFIITLLIVPGAAMTFQRVEDGTLISRESRSLDQTVVIYTMDLNLTSQQMKVSTPYPASSPEFRPPPSRVIPFRISHTSWRPDGDRESLPRIYRLKPRDPYLPLILSATRLKMWLNPSISSNLLIYQVNSITIQPEETEALEWRTLIAGGTDYTTLTIPADRDRVWVDIQYEGGPLILTAYPPDAVLGPFEDADDGEIDSRIYLEITGEDTIPEGEWYFRIENTGIEDTRFAFTIWY
jgi:hypothetical protein